MIRNIIVLFSFLLFSIITNGQIKKFDKKFGYFEYELVPMQQIVDSQNNHIVAGLFRGAHKIGNTIIQTRGDVDIFMIKYDASNNIVWVKTFGSSAGENITSLNCDKDGNILFTGSFMGNAFYASANDSLEILSAFSQSRYVVKLDASGSLKWAKRFSATTNQSDVKSEVFADHNGRVYLIHTNRANGTLNYWQFQDSIIANPTNAYINIPRWMMLRLDEQTGNIKWLDYIANPLIGSNFITYLNISRPVVDSRNYINFAITYDGRNVDPIYIFGQYVALNSRVNNVLIKIDSLGVVNRIRDMGAGNTYISESSDLAITKNDELVLINKRASGSENGITYNYLTNTAGINYARFFDSTFSLVKITQLGNQSIMSYAFDKQNRLITLGSSSAANFNVAPVNEIVKVDSVQSVTFNTQSQVYLYYVRYNNQFKADTFFLENNAKPLTPVGANSNALRISNNGNIIPNIILGQMNNVVFRYDSLFRPVNINYGTQRDKEDPIINLVEDDSSNVFTIGMIQGKTFFTRKAGVDSLLIPYEKGADAFVSKYDSLGNITWIKTFSSASNDNINFLRKTKTGLIFFVQSLASTNLLYNDTSAISGKLSLIKIDFDGNLLWKKTIVNQVTGQVPAINILKSLNNGKILLGLYFTDNFNYDNQLINKLGNNPSQTILVLDESTGDIIRYNRFTLRNENFSYFGGVLQKAHEDDRGNLYFGAVSYVGNINSSATTNELYSLKNNTVTFTHNWANQSSLLKLDSNLEIKSFKQFLAYSYLYDITGQGNKIYLTGKGRNNQFNFGDTTITLHSYAQQKHFVNYFAVLDTNFRFNKIMKYDTSVIENQFNSFSRKILINPTTKDVYQTLQFVGNTKIDSSLTDINSKGGSDMLFLKYDSVGNLLGGQQLGTPQNDFFLDAIINKKGNLIFASQAVDPNYISTIIYKDKGNNSTTSINNSPATLITEARKIKSFSTSSENVIDKNVLSPDNYLSQYSSLREIGYNPDTSLNVNQTNFCKGDSAVLTVKEVTDIKWKKNNEVINGENSIIFKPKSTGKYKAILTTVENRADSTREVEIFVDDVPTPAVTADINYCVGSAAGVLSATATTGSALKWYGALATGGTASSTAPTPATTTAGTYEYYVSQASTSTGCESGRSKITMVVNEVPSVPAVSDIAYCAGTTANALSATATTGSALKWYGALATGGTASSTAPTPATTTAGSYEYYVSQASTSTGCESGRSKITMVVNALPSVPVVSDINYCVGSAAGVLSATATTGSALKWYGALATGGTASSVAPTPATTTAGSYEYYVSQASTSTGCESGRSKITMVVNALPSVPVVSDINYCVGSAAGVLSATATTGSTLKWYGALATGGTASSTAPTPVTTTVGNFEYYVSQASTSTGCESMRAKLNVAINPIPSAPFITRDLDNYLVSSATSGNTWYKDGIALPDTTQKFKPTINGKYSVSTMQKGCNSVSSIIYYYIITDVIHLSDFEFIKLSPNPFMSQLNLDFSIKGHQRLNMEVFELSTGNRVANKLDLLPDSPVYLGGLISGTYLIRISSLDNKINHQFKMIKL